MFRENFSALSLPYQRPHPVYDTSDFSNLPFIDNSPSLWERERIFFKVPISVKIHKGFERHG